MTTSFWIAVIVFTTVSGGSRSAIKVDSEAECKATIESISKQSPRHIDYNVRKFSYCVPVKK